MKSLIVFALTLSVLSVSAMADSSVYSFGRGNVISGSLSNSTELTMLKRDNLEIYYSLSCKGSGFLSSKNRLVFKIVDKTSQEIITKAETKVENCKQLLRDTYRIAFEKKSAIIFSLVGEPNDDGVYGLSVSQSTSLEVAE